MVTETVETILEREKKSDEKLVEAKQRAKAIIAGTSSQAEHDREKAVSEAKDEASRIIAKAQSEIDDEYAKASTQAEKQSTEIRERKKQDDSKVTEIVKEILFS